jgi:O-antigen ligase
MPRLITLSDRIYNNRIAIFYSIAIFSLLLFITGFLVQVPYLGLISFLAIGAIVLIYDYKLLFYFLLLTLPLSDELQIADGLMMYIPTEPITIVLMGVSLVYVILNRHLLKGKFWTHPITIIIYINLIWIVISTISSTHPVISIKYLLAKLWFVVVYYFLASHILNTYSNVRNALWLLFLATFFGVSYVMIKHGLTGFLFDTISPSVRPFYRNHVDYGVWIAAIFPLLFLAASWYKKDTLKRLFFVGFVILTGFALFYSYTRGAWVAIFCIPIFVLIVRNKLVKLALLTSTLAISLFLGFILNQNRYLHYAPEFSKTIYHEEFADHMNATFQMQDMSTVERFYRWIAAVKMFQARPITGFGPGNFVNNYKNYTISAYETYISENEEGSSVHNYFLTMLTEQGIPGLVIFIVLIFTILIYFERVYHQIEDVQQKRLILGLSCCFLVLLVNNMFSDLVEADKLGPMFFICIAILVKWDIKNNKALSKETEALIR